MQLCRNLFCVRKWGLYYVIMMTISSLCKIRSSHLYSGIEDYKRRSFSWYPFSCVASIPVPEGRVHMPVPDTRIEYLGMGKVCILAPRTRDSIIKKGTYWLNGMAYPMCGYSRGTADLANCKFVGKNVMTPKFTKFLLAVYRVWFRTYVKHFATQFKFHWIASKYGRLILHWFTRNVFMVLCSPLMEHNLTTKLAPKKYTYVFNTEK